MSLRPFQNRVFKVVVQLRPQANAVPPVHVGLVLFQVSQRRNRGRYTWKMCRDRSHVNKWFAAGPEWIWVFGPGQLVSCAFVEKGRKTMSWHRPWDQRLSEGGGGAADGHDPCARTTSLCQLLLLWRFKVINRVNYTAFYIFRILKHYFLNTGWETKF